MRASPTDVRRALKGVDYPASREELIDHARENEAPDEVIEDLEQELPEEEYESPAEVMAELGEEE